MYRRILVAIDETAASRLAVAEAVRLAGQQRDAQLLLVHVLHQTPFDAADSGWIEDEEMHEAQQQTARKMMDESAAVACQAGISSEIVVLETLGREPGQVLQEEADRWCADLIVMGVHSNRGIGRMLQNGVAEDVMRCARQPVLLVPGQ